jgi:hypothetical protein
MMNLPNPVVGITAKRGQHTIRIAATATSKEQAETMIAPLVQTIEQRFAGHLLGEETLEQRVARLLQERDLALVLHEAFPEAPAYRLLSSVPAGSAALGRGAATIRSWAKHEGALNQDALGRAARQAIEDLRSPDGNVVALVVVPEVDAAHAEYCNVHFLASDGARTEYAARGFDLNIAVGFELVAATAVETLRRWLD